MNLTNSGTCVTTIAIQIAQDTPVELIERLKSSLVKYTIENAERTERAPSQAPMHR